MGSDYLGPRQTGRSVVIGGDNDDPSLLQTVVQSADLFIHEATLIQSIKDRLAFKAFHSTAADVAKTAQKAKVKNLILTHISARFAPEGSGQNPTVRDIKQEAETYYDGHLWIAEDMQVFDLDRRGGLHRMDS